MFLRKVLVERLRGTWRVEYDQVKTSTRGLEKSRQDWTSQIVRRITLSPIRPTVYGLGSSAFTDSIRRCRTSE
jgi:hypothetical protein